MHILKSLDTEVFNRKKMMESESSEGEIYVFLLGLMDDCLI